MSQMVFKHTVPYHSQTTTSLSTFTFISFLSNNMSKFTFATPNIITYDIIRSSFVIHFSWHQIYFCIWKRINELLFIQKWNKNIVKKKNTQNKYFVKICIIYFPKFSSPPLSQTITSFCRYNFFLLCMQK